MGLFSAKQRPVKRITRPPENNITAPLNEALYNILFADSPSYYEKMKDNDAISWIYTKDVITKDKLTRVINDENVESRLRFLASYTALKNGISISEKRYFGSILEVPVNGGYDILAFYSDLKARYYNHSGNAIVYENGGIDEIDRLIKSTNSISESICQVLGPWDKPRLERPSGNVTRFSYLMSDGLYFGQGPIDQMSKDEMGKVILGSGAQLMAGLIKLVRGQS